MFNLATRPQPVIIVLRDSLKLYKIVFLRILLFSAFSALLLLIPNFVMHSQGTILESWRYIISRVLIGFVELWINAVLIHATYQSMIQSKKSLGNSCLVALQKYGIYLIASLLYAIMSIIGFVLIFLPGIFVQVLFAFYLVFILIENDGIITSLKHSAKLVWGHWWRALFTLLIPMVMFAIVAGIVESIFQFPVVFLYRRMLHEVNWKTYVALWILLIIFIPWLISVGLCLYQDLRCRSLNSLP